jgi:hypothetical protein
VKLQFFLVLTTFFAFEKMMFGYKSIVYFEGLFYIKILLRILGNGDVITQDYEMQVGGNKLKICLHICQIIH